MLDSVGPGLSKYSAMRRRDEIYDQRERGIAICRLESSAYVRFLSSSNFWNYGPRSEKFEARSPKLEARGRPERPKFEDSIS